MAIQIQGYSGIVAECDGATYRALRVTIRPVDYGSLGQYRCVMWNGGIGTYIAAGLAANSEIFQARWTASPELALVWGVNIDGMWSNVGFTAGFANLSLTIARSWTVNGSGGVTASLAGNNQKLRTSMASSLMGTIRSATTVALGTGTKTLDSQPVGRLAFSVNTSANTNFLGQRSLYGSPSLESGGNPAPIVLSQNEGLVVRATVPATGTWAYGVTMAWSEVSAY